MIDAPQDTEERSSSSLHGNEEQCKRRPSKCEESETCCSNCVAYGRVCPCHARTAGKAVCSRVHSILKDSLVFVDGEPSFRRIQPSEITLGKRLGEGGFSLVETCELKGVDPTKKFVIKHLKRSIMVEVKTFVYGASDLVNEALFLARLDHPNIIQLYGVTEGNMEQVVSTDRDAGFFIVLDQLVETLDQRLEDWRAHARTLPSSIFHRMSNAYKETQRKVLIERLEVALDVANVMQYLHSLDIVFRDLKPDNIGFDEKGIMKLFDFGLAKELKESHKISDGRYEMTGHTGSRRYMSPEVAQDRPYGKGVDVYSFGILLWEMCTSEKPFVGYSNARHMREVINGGERPKMDSTHTSHWPLNLQWMIKSCWSPHPDARPSFETIIETLNNILMELKNQSFRRVRAISEGGGTVPDNDGLGVLHDSSSPIRSPFQKGRPTLKIPRLVSRP